MKKILSMVLLVVVFSSMVLGSVFALTLEPTEKIFFVSPNGDDANSGTEDAPFATLERARGAIREFKNSTGLPDGGATVYIREGTYSLNQSFKLDEQDSGTQRSPITYQAYAGEKVYIMGGYDLDTNAFEPVTDETILNRLPYESRDKVLQIDLQTQGINEYGNIPKNGHGWPKMPPPPELFVDNEVMTLARYPNNEYLETGTVIDEGFIPREHTSDKPAGDPSHPDYVPKEEWISQPGPIFKYSDYHIRNWVNEDEVWLFGYWKWDWADDNLKVKSIKTFPRRIEIEHPSFYGVKSGQRYFAYNLLCEIDMPGEWYLDRNTGILYLYPIADINNSKVQLSILDTPLFDMNRVSNVKIKDITFEISRGHGIQMMDCSNNLVAHCVFRRLGQKAVVIGDEEVAFDGTILLDSESGGGRNNGIMSCDIYETGAGGISIMGGDRNTLTPAGNYAENNHIYNYARLIRTYTPAINLNGVGNRASNNLIHTAPHMAIQFRGNDLIIENNEIYDVCKETSDAGVIYSCRDWTYRGNVIRYNYIHDISSMNGEGSSAIYLDDMMSSAHVHGNVFYNIQNRTFLIGGGRDHNVENNMIIDCGKSIWLDNRAEGWASATAEAPNGTCYKALMNVPYKQEPWKSKYPKLVNLWEDEPKVPKGNTIINNVLYNTSEMSIADSALANGTIENNLVLTEDQDAGFVDKDNEDFTLREDSIIYEQLPDFQPIPFDEIGLRIDEYRTSLEN